MIPRRHVLTALAALPLTAASPPTGTPTPASGTADRVLSCDAVLGSAIRRPAEHFRKVANAQRGRWRDPLLAACRGAAPDAPAGRPAVADASPLFDRDGPEIAARLGLAPAEPVTVIDAERILLRQGEVEAGLPHASDVVGRSDLEIVKTVPDNVASASIDVIAVTSLARRPNLGTFVGFLVSLEGSAIPADSGSERIA